MKLTAIIEKGEKYYVASCPEIDIASQGENIENAVDNLKEAVELYFEELEDEKSKQIILNKKLFITSFYANA